MLVRHPRGLASLLVTTFAALVACDDDRRTPPATIPPGYVSAEEAEFRVKRCETTWEAKTKALELEVIGLRGLLPPPKKPTPPAGPDALVGVWRTGMNPQLMQGEAVVVSSLFEERIHFMSDGRVCGVDVMMAPSGGYHPFQGTWRFEKGMLIEEYTSETAPASLHGKETMRKRKVLHLGERSQGELLLAGNFPNRYEGVPREQTSDFRSIGNGRSIPITGVMDGCFELEKL
jgi:hypothetical protein